MYRENREYSENWEYRRTGSTGVEEVLVEQKEQGE